MYGPILYRFPHIGLASYWSKVVEFIYLTCIQRREFRKDIWY